MDDQLDAIVKLTEPRSDQDVKSFWQAKREDIMRVMDERYATIPRKTDDVYTPLFLNVGNQQYFMAAQYLKTADVKPVFFMNSLVRLENVNESLTLEDALLSVGGKERVRIGLKVDNKIYLEYLLSQLRSTKTELTSGPLQGADITYF